MTDVSFDPIAAALAEDLGSSAPSPVAQASSLPAPGSGDVTCAFFVPENARSSARIVARENAVVAGAEVAAKVFARVDPALEVHIVTSDGHAIAPPDTVLEITGSVRSILTAERVALNFLQQLSGVATLTRRFVEAVAHTSAVILDTRKTTPGLRALEKAAVVAGGGRTHRMGLYDRAMVKDNHLVASHDPARIGEQIARLKKARPEIQVELEADRLDQVEAFLRLEGVDFILLDNMSLAELRQAVEMNQGRVKLEASGGVNLETVGAIAETGVDFISVGALTHSAPAVDFSLELQHG